MRLICPNCGAQYEVDGNVIPDAGRDVQCSNCGHTWFQKLAHQEAEIAGQRADAGTAQSNEAADAAPPAAADTPVTETAEPPDQQKTQIAPPQRQPLDEEVAGVLRQEAALETSQRAADPAPIAPPTTKPEPTADKSKSMFAQRPAELHPTDGPDSNDSSRKDLLPDIEEINSTLTATGGTQAVPDAQAAADLRRRSGFRRGFSFSVLIFAVMALLYVFAPNIADSVPGTATSLASYVDWINSLRVSVDGVMQGAVEKLTGLLAQISGDQAG